MPKELESKPIIIQMTTKNVIRKICIREDANKSIRRYCYTFNEEWIKRCCRCPKKDSVRRKKQL